MIFVNEYYLINEYPRDLTKTSIAEHIRTIASIISFFFKDNWDDTFKLALVVEFNSASGRV